MNKENFCLLLVALKEDLKDKDKVASHLNTHFHIDMSIFNQKRLMETVAEVLISSVKDKGAIEWYMQEHPSYSHYVSPLNGNYYKIETAEDVWEYNQLFAEKEA